jgi:hypothetical protein
MSGTTSSSFYELHNSGFRHTKDIVAKIIDYVRPPRLV